MLLLSSVVCTGCAALIGGLAEELADGGSGRSLPSKPTELAIAESRSVPPRTDARPMTSEYQAAATIDWTLYRFGPPFSVSRALFELPASTGQVCRAAPLGLARNLADGEFWRLDAPDDPYAPGAASRPIADLGRSERELLDNSVRLSTLAVADENDLAAHYLASAARMGQQGNVCSASLFFHVWVSGDEAAVTLLR